MCKPIYNFSKTSFMLIFPVFRPPLLTSAFIFPLFSEALGYKGSLQSTCNKGSKELSIKFAAPICRNYHVAWVLSPSVVSNSLRLHGLQPTRLHHPWNFPGKSTGWVAISFSRGSSRPPERENVDFVWKPCEMSPKSFKVRPIFRKLEPYSQLLTEQLCLEASKNLELNMSEIKSFICSMLCPPGFLCH